MKPQFYKMSGSGNDFVIIDNRDGSMNGFDLPEFIPAVCSRSVSVGADGLILIEDSDTGKADFKWRFYNSDASEAEMCGNGSRCAARFAYLNGIAGERMKFETVAGIIEAEIKDEPDVKVQLTDPFDLRENFELQLEEEKVTVSHINTGVPHVGMQVEDIDKVDLMKYGSAIRYHSEFAPKGANVNLYEKTAEDTIRVRTYERGVEGETQACGTGSVACSIFAVNAGLVKSPVTVVTTSGIELKVYLEDDKVYLEGEARVVYTGELWSEAYKY
ncbi:diaminopimelate epimerase [Limisalsivibrio acetivorans]|uniref:diaminopimelate epimerase n=1 Tax=Limisalsivibrio acetivorans TaxID=1304888 RepID=UPI0003B6DBE6|nr:diaminopimelate epimerase [Limisalsivibrio acetivorans]